MSDAFHDRIACFRLPSERNITGVLQIIRQSAAHQFDLRANLNREAVNERVETNVKDYHVEYHQNVLQIRS